MPSQLDVALGRLAASRGLVPLKVIREVYRTLGPGESLAQALLRVGQLTPSHAAALEAEVRRLAAQAGAGGSLQQDARADSAELAKRPGESGQWLGGAAGVPLPGQPPGPPRSPAGADEDGLETMAPGFSHGATTAAPPSRSGTLPPPPPSGPGGPGLAPPRPQEAARRRLPEPGELVAGRYRVEKTLGKGGMGAVYRAQDERMSRAVALKVILPGAGSERFYERFRREAEALAKVDAHEGIVRILDYGQAEGSPYAALELVEGEDLADRLERDGALPLAAAISLGSKISRAIAHCHDKGVLHRDLKPANVLLRAADGQPFVTDFGLAKDAEQDRLTKTGELLGTPAYMPPEQAEGDVRAMDERSDVYSLGALIHHLVAGQAPFTGGRIQILRKVMFEAPPSLSTARSRSGLASASSSSPGSSGSSPGEEAALPDLEVIVSKALAKEPGRRYRSARALADDLDRLGRGEPITARPPSALELFRWQLKRRQPRALVLVATPLVLVALAVMAGAFVVLRSRGGGQLEQAREAFMVGVETGLPLSASGSWGRLSQLEEALAVAAADGEAPALVHRAASRIRAGGAPSTGTREKLVAWLGAALDGSDPEAAALLESASGADGAARARFRRALVRLVRRIELRAGSGVVWPEREPRATADGDDEERLLLALAQLGFAQDAAQDVVDEEALLAGLKLLCGLLDGASPAGERTPAGREAEAVGTLFLGELRLRGVQEGKLDREGLLGAASAALGEEIARALLGLEEPGLASLGPVDPRDERPELGDALHHAQSVFAEAISQKVAIAKISQVIEEVRQTERDWSSSQAYAEVRRQLDPAIAQVEQLGLRELPQRLKTGANELLFAVFADLEPRFKAGNRLPPQLFELLELVEPIADWSDPRLGEAGIDAMFDGLRRALERGEEFSVRRLVLLPRMRYVPPSPVRPLLKQYLDRGEFERELKVRPSGDGFFMWGRAISVARSKRGAELSAALAEIYGQALGLSAAERQELGLEQEPVELKIPLSPWWRAWATSLMVRYVLRREVDLADPSRPVQRACLARLQQLRAMRTGLDQFQDLTNWLDAMVLLSQLLVSLSETEASGDPMPLVRQALEVHEERSQEAWRFLAVAQTSSAEELGFSEESVLGIDNRLNPLQIQRQITSGLIEETILLTRLGHPDKALERLLAARQRFAELSCPRDLKLEHAVATRLAELGRTEEAIEVAKEVIEDVTRAPGALADYRKERREWGEKCRVLLAQIALGQGDEAGAREVVEEAYRRGALDLDFWGRVLLDLGLDPGVYGKEPPSDGD